MAPILANIYVAMLENELRAKCKNDPKLNWPILLKRFIDDGFGILCGTKEDIVYWIDKWSIGNKVEYVDLEIHKGSRFLTC